MTNPDHHCAHRQGITPPPVLLDGGCTANSCVKISIPCHEDSTCRIRKNSHLHEILLQTGVIIWDEAPMQHKFGPEALDWTLQELSKNDSFFRELLFSLVEIFIRLFQSFPKVPNKRSWVLLTVNHICGETPMYITLLKTAAWSTALRMLLFHSIYWMLALEDVQRLMDQSLFLLAYVVVTPLETSFLKFIAIFLTLRETLTSGFLNIQFSPARMMMLTISTLIYWACSLESKKLYKVLTL